MFEPLDTFVRRHIGSNDAEIGEMLQALGLDSLDALVQETVPASIRAARSLAIDASGEDREPGEQEMLDRLQSIAARNRRSRSYLGLGYNASRMPGVIQRNILENPGWYTQYTPYQAEIAQGRLEALLNYQTMIADLTALPIANASLLDEATAAAEAMHMCAAIHPHLEKIERPVFFVDEACHPQTLAVVRTRAGAVGIEVATGDPFRCDFAGGRVFGVLVQYPTTDGKVLDYAPLATLAHSGGALLVVAADLLSLALLRLADQVLQLATAEFSNIHGCSWNGLGRHRLGRIGPASLPIWSHFARKPRVNRPRTIPAGAVPGYFAGWTGEIRDRARHGPARRSRTGSAAPQGQPRRGGEGQGGA